MGRLIHRRTFIKALSILWAGLWFGLKPAQAGFVVIYVHKSGDCGQVETATVLAEAMLTESWYTIILPGEKGLQNYIDSLAGLACQQIYLPLIER